MGEKRVRKVGIAIDRASTFMSGSPDRSLRMKILSDPAELSRVRSAVERFALDAGFDEKSAGDVILALDEALTNIMRHAYDGVKDQPIEIEVTRQDKKLNVVLRDYGRVEDRSRIRSRDLDDVRPGGLGVYIMNECMDSVEHVPAEGGGTRLTMKKSIVPNRTRKEKNDK